MDRDVVALTPTPLMLQAMTSNESLEGFVHRGRAFIVTTTESLVSRKVQQNCKVSLKEKAMLDSMPTHFALEINSALDSGHYDDISVDEIQEQVRHGNLIDWLRGRLGKDVDLTLFDSDAAAEMEKILGDIDAGYGNQTRRKFGVENRGLCLLVAWAIEIEAQRLHKKK